MDSGSSGLFRHAVVLGAGGMLGRQVVAELQHRGVAHRAYARADLDVADAAAVQRALAEPRPSLIFNCAAFTKVDDCETRREHAMAINGEAAGTLADVAKRSAALLVHVSSDYIFGGGGFAGGARPYREDDPPAADAELSAYALSKLEGDRRVLASGCRCLIARTSWVFGPFGPNFADTIINAARARPELKVVDDQRGRPTYTVDLAAGIFALLDRGVEGVVNVTNSDECTWYEYAREILKRCGIGTPVKPCTTAEFPRPAKRPAYSVLDQAKYRSIVGSTLRSWRDALQAYLDSRIDKPAP